MDADAVAEAQLVLRTVDVQVVGLAVAGLLHRLDPAEDVVAEKEAGQVVDQAPAGAGVVDARLTCLRVPADRTVGRPQVPDEMSDLLRGETENAGGDELLVAALPEQTEVVEPGGDRVTLPASQSVRRRQAKRGHPSGGVLVADRRDPEAPVRRVGNRGQVGLVDARVTDRLAFDEGPVAEQMSEQGELVLVPRRRVERRRDVPERSHSRAGSQLAQRLPAVIRQERMVGSGLDLPAGGELQPEDLLHTARKSMRQRARDQLQPIVE